MGILREGDATLGLDGLETCCAIRGGSRKQHANRVRLAFARQGVQERINSVTLSAERKQRSKREGPLFKYEGCIGGNDIHLVGLDKHPIGNFMYGHGGHASKQTGQETGMGGVQMLDENIGHAGCGGEMLQ